MSERQAAVARRIATVRQLGTVVNAMRGIAATRAQQARARLPAVRAYAETAASAIAQARRLVATPPVAAGGASRGRPGLVVFGAEQGFAGGYPEQVLNAAAGEMAAAHVFLIGSRTLAIAAERGLGAAWSASLPAGVAALIDTAGAIVDAVYGYLSIGGALPVAVVYPVWKTGLGVRLVRRSLLPLALRDGSPNGSGPLPIANLPATDLMERLAQEYIFAQICEAAIEAFATENEARAAAMAAAKTNVETRLEALQAEERLSRQEEITAEVVELAAGARFRRAR